MRKKGAVPLSVHVYQPFLKLHKIEVLKYIADEKKLHVICIICSINRKRNIVDIQVSILPEQSGNKYYTIIQKGSDPFLTTNNILYKSSPKR